MFLNALPGLLAGIQIAGLLFFLNPDLPFASAPLLRAGLLYGGLLGLASSVVLTLFTWRRPHRARRALPWLITSVLAVAALLQWTYASWYSYMLPGGINARMIKAAIGLSLTALACFYTALLHSLQRKPYGRRSQIGLTLLALASVYVVAERREAFRPRTPPPPLPSMVELEQRPSLLVVGIEGATLDVILPMARQGRLPFLARLIETGSFARVNSFPPAVPAALWTTMATGKLPYEHGVVSHRVYPADLIQPGALLKLLPAGIGFPVWGTFGRSAKPVDADFRRSPALWEILDGLGIPSGLVGWPLTFPVPDSLDYAFSDRFFDEHFTASSAQPDELAERGQLFRIEPEELDPSLLEGFGATVPFSLLEALSSDLWRESLSRFLLEQHHETEAVFVMLPGLGKVSRGLYGGFSAVQFAGSQDSEHQAAAHTLAGYYRHLDQFLAEIWERRAGPRILAVVSAYGFEAPEGLRRLRLQLLGRSLEGFSHRAPDGILLLNGDGIRAGVFLEDTELIDLFPTLLYALDLPIARDLEGRVLVSVFDGAFLARNPLTFVPSYDTLAAHRRAVQLPKPLEE